MKTPDADVQAQIALGIPMSIFGMVTGKIGDILANLPEGWKTLLFVSGTILLFVGIAYGVFASFRNKKSRRAERKHDVRNALIFGGLGAIFVFVTTPLYHWVSPYEALEGAVPSWGVWSYAVFFAGMVLVISAIVRLYSRK